jgi:hypothetical protein
MTDEVYEVYDNFLEPHVAEYIDNMVQKAQWKYGFRSNPHYGTKHWNVKLGESREEIENSQYDYTLAIWDAAIDKYKFDEVYGVQDFRRAYMNAHTYGMQPHWHKDDGSFTMIYYPTMHWPIEWEGGTIIYSEEENPNEEPDPRYGHPPKSVAHINQYVGNRVLVFDAYRWHSAQQVRRECYELRPVIVFKMHIDGEQRQRLDFYKS